MAQTDPISDYLTRIRNAQKARHRFVEIPCSKMKERIAEIMKREGYIKGYEVLTTTGVKKMIKVELRYNRKGQPLIRTISRVSKPGYRRYVKSEDLSKVRDVVTTTILSTSKGIMTDRDATESKVGGELICRIS
ncbi:MAG: 30S ribosomal protein S8 [Bdellovibrionales bacterium]|nr:30S ribosomal protein S8 [Bdellovibrionales bacterium]